MYYGKNWLYSGKSGCNWEKWLYLGKSGCTQAMCFIRAKVVLFGCNLYLVVLGFICQRGCIRAKVVVFGQIWLYSGKSGCIRAKVVVFGQ